MPQGAQEGERPFGIAAAFDDQAGQMFFGPENPLTLFSMYALGEQLLTEHRYQEAEHLFGEVLETQRRILGPEHQETLLTMVDLGATYSYQHRYTDADRVNREALSIARKGSLNPVVASLFYNLACSAAIQSRRQEALADLQQAVDHGGR